MNTSDIFAATAGFTTGCILLYFLSKLYNRLVMSYTDEIIYQRTIYDYWMPDTLLLVIKRTYSNDKVKIIHKKIRY